MDIREKGKNALRLIMNKENNVSIFERRIYAGCGDDTDLYLRTISQVVLDYDSDKSIVENFRRIKEWKLDWEHECFDDERFYLNEQNGFIEKPFEVEEGVFECSCGSKRVYSFTKQTRSADEPMTTFAQCSECGKKWQYSG